MLARDNRLSGAESLNKVKEEGNIFQSDSFAIVVLARKNGGPNRFGFVVSNKISKKANERNKIKRILREAVKTDLPRMKLGLDIVFLVKKKALNRQTKSLIKEVSTVFEKAGLLK